MEDAGGSNTGIGIIAGVALVRLGVASLHVRPRTKSNKRAHFYRTSAKRPVCGNVAGQVLVVGWKIGGLGFPVSNHNTISCGHVLPPVPATQDPPRPHLEPVVEHTIDGREIQFGIQIT